MGTHVKAVSAAGTNDDMAQYGGLKSTTVRVSDDTKRLLDRLREQDGAAGSFDELLFRVLSAMVQPELPLGIQAQKGAGAGRRAAGSDDVAALRAEVENLNGQVVELIDTVGSLLALLDGQAQDPGTGLLFNWRRAKHAHAGKLPKPGKDGMVRENELFGRSEPESEAGVWVQAPSGAYLTERDATLTSDAVEAIRAEVLDKKAAAKKPGTKTR